MAKHHQRAKHEKLDDETIKSIIFDLNKKNASVKSLAHRYYWSKSTIYNVKCQKNYYLNGDSKRHIRKLSNNEEKDIERTIKNYLATHHLPWTVSDVTKYTNDKLLKVFPTHAIRKIMINNAKLSYKKVSSRANNHSMDLLKEARTLFSIKYLELLTNETLLLNVDEASFGRAWRISYSWSHKGKSQEWQNITISGSIKLILGIASNGWWFSMITHKNINSN